MALKRRATSKISTQIKRKVTDSAKPKRNGKGKLDGNTEIMISTGSTLLDLAISGGRVPGGGIPGGIMVVAYGPSGSGKTVLACEIAGAIQRSGGKVNYRDSEARLDREFSEIFDLDYDNIAYDKPNTVAEAFRPLFNWAPKDLTKVNGYIVDSLAALSTDMEMDNEDGDKMGTRRAKEFSEHLRKGARVITDKNFLLFCTNQIREKIGATQYERKDINPGGKAIEFYASLILRFNNSQKIKKKVKVAGKEVTRIVGIKTIIEVVKSSIWKPYRSAPVTIYFDYGIDDIRENLQFIKDYTKNTAYMVGDALVGKSMDDAIASVEENRLESRLKREVRKLWQLIEDEFEMPRKTKVR